MWTKGNKNVNERKLKGKWKLSKGKWKESKRRIKVNQKENDRKLKGGDKKVIQKVKSMKEN